MSWSNPSIHAISSLESVGVTLTPIVFTGTWVTIRIIWGSATADSFPPESVAVREIIWIPCVNSD